MSKKEQASIQEIAASLLVKSPKEGTKQSTQVIDEDTKEETASDETSEEETHEEPLTDKSPTEGTDEVSDDSDDPKDDESEENEVVDDEETEDDQASEEVFTISDDDVLEVTVDGEVRELTIGELKKAAAGEGAIDKRLKEATEMRKSAHAEGTQWLEKLYAQEQVVSTALSQLDDSAFKGFIPAPPDELKKRDPASYLRHKELYDAEQAHLKTLKQSVQDKVAELEKQRQERLKEYASKSAQVIAKELPELVDPKTSKVAFEELREVAHSYGYTDAEIASALDPRMFMLVRDAAKYRKLSSKSKEHRNVTDLKEAQAKKVRKLRSGNTSARTRVAASMKQAQQATERARQTGSVKDVAATLLKPR